MRIATVDAVTGRIIDATLSIDARGQPLKGALVTVRCGDDFLLGRIVTIDLSNVVHKNETFAPYIMQHGAVKHWSGEVDIERAKIELIRAVDADGASIAMRRNPASGTPIHSLEAADLDKFKNELEHILAVGEIPNSGGLRSTIINRHFGLYERGGYGEGRHNAVFGQNGSGKTVLATALIAGRLAQNPEMGLLMPDTAGDLVNPASHSRGAFQWNYATVLKQAGIQLEVIDLSDIRLTSKHTLRAQLAPVLQSMLSMDSEKANELSNRIVNAIIADRKVRASEVTSDAVLDAAIIEIGHCYAKASRQQKEDHAKDLRDNPRQRRPFDDRIQRIAELFDGREDIDHLVRRVLCDGAKIIISAGSAGQSGAQDLLMYEIMSQLAWQAERAFKDRGNNSCNALIVLDEGQRWVPETGDDEKNVGVIIKRALRETRKYGVGWMIIAQSPSGVSKDVLRQSHTVYFGRGLGIGADRRHLEDVLGKDGVEAYQQIEMQGGYFWVGIGLDNNIGTESSYFSFRPFDGDATTEFMRANPTIFGAV